VQATGRSDDLAVWWRRRPGATLDDVVELLRGIGTILMKIDAKLDEVIRLLEDDDDGEADS
jgi:hypothetical protein